MEKWKKRKIPFGKQKLKIKSTDLFLDLNFFQFDYFLLEPNLINLDIEEKI